MDALVVEIAKRRRLSPVQRRKEILQKAIALFAEEGFESSTRELARRLGITQPLLYRYFPSKDDLIRNVYEAVYLNRWENEWDRLLCDRSVAIEERLREFYTKYTDAIFSREWMRIYFFSGLRGEAINRWYIGLLEERILMRIAKEFRESAGINSENSVSPEELELIWALHSAIFYVGAREHIYGLKPHASRELVILNTVRAFFVGMVDFYERMARANLAPSRIKGGVREATRPARRSRERPVAG